MLGDSFIHEKEIIVQFQSLWNVYVYPVDKTVTSINGMRCIVILHALMNIEQNHPLGKRVHKLQKRFFPTTLFSS